MRINLSELTLSKKDVQRGLKFPNIHSKELAYLCGVLAGDGHISKNYGNKCRNVIYCSGNPKDEVTYYNKIISPLFLKLFNIKLKPKNFSDGTYGIKIESKGLVEFFTRIIMLPRGSKYDKLKIPDLFKENSLSKQFISGLFDTDFGFTLRRNKYPVLCLVSKSKSFIYEIYNKLIKYELSPIKPYKLKQYDKRFKKGFAITYRFDINGNNQLLKLYKLIRFRHPKNIKKFETFKKIFNYK